MAPSLTQTEGTTSHDPGKAHNQGPSSGLQSAHGDAKTQIKNDINSPSPQKMAAPYALLEQLAKTATTEAAKEKAEGEGMAAAEKGLAKAEAAHAAENNKETKKEGSGNAFLDYLLTRPKTAEDATNPAHISAGKAVPPQTSASGEAGGSPAGGQPQGPRGLIASNKAAIDFKRRDAYAPRVSDLTKFLTEPAMNASTDKTLAHAFTHTSEAGPKIASADPPPPADQMAKVAAGRALLAKLAQAQDANNKPAPARA